MLSRPFLKFLPRSFFEGIHVKNHPQLLCETRRRRENLAENLPDSFMVLATNLDSWVRSHDQLYPPRPNANFFYLTGLELNPAAFLMFRRFAGENFKTILFAEKPSELKSVWEGAMPDFAEIAEVSGFEKVVEIERMRGTLFRQQRYFDELWIDYNDVYPDALEGNGSPALLNDLRSKLPGLAMRKLMPIMDGLRMEKSAFETERIREAAAILERAFAVLLKAGLKGKKECEAAAALEGFFIAEGSVPAFRTIVAGGGNALYLHYSENGDPLREGELALIDVGCEVGNYACDVSRTLPVSGTYSERQRELYEAVLDVQSELIDELKTGLTLHEINGNGNKKTAAKLISLGLAKDAKEAAKLTIHSVSHSLGLDVHDPADPYEPLREGSVITVEPGFYLPEENLGIRIEDDVLIKNDGIEVLTAGIPKTVEAIERALKST